MNNQTNYDNSCGERLEIINYIEYNYIILVIHSFQLIIPVFSASQRDNSSLD